MPPGRVVLTTQPAAHPQAVRRRELEPRLAELRAREIAGAHNRLLDHTVLGTPLSQHLLGAGADERWMADSMEQVTRVMPLLSFLTVAAVASLPLAAGLYLVTSTTWSLLERASLRRIRHRRPRTEGARLSQA